MAAMTAPSTIGALHMTTRSRRRSSSISIAISLFVSAPPRSTRTATPASDQARSMAVMIAATSVPRLAVRVASGEGDGDRVADHLPHHIGRAFRHLRGMRYDDNSDIPQDQPPNTSQAASIISADERAPGSMCPIDARPEKRRARG